MTNRFEKDMILYRPVGLEELALIYDSGMKAFPARLPQQPIFYPVLDLEYARQTASGWNAKNGQLAGYVTQFKVEDQYIGQLEKHTVGGSQHQELWIPAEEVEEFNKHILGHVKVLEGYFGDGFQGFVPEQFGLQGKNAVEQFTLLANSYLYKRMDFYLEIKRNHKAVFLNYPFWQTYAFKNPGLKEKIIQAIKEAWLTSFPQNPLPLPPPAQEDAAPARQPDAPVPAQPLSKRVPENIALETETDPNSWADPDDEDVAPVEQTDPDPWTDPDDEDDTQVKKSNVFVNVVREDIPPIKQTHANPQRLINPVHEDFSPVEQTDPDPWAEPDDEATMPEEQTDSPLGANPVQEEILSVEQAHRREQHWVNPVPQKATFLEQTDSSFMQGIKLGLGEKYHEAIDKLSRAVEEDPEHVVAHTSLGVAFHRLGEDARALACYETALRIEPKHAQAHYFRANLLYSQGNVREAIAGYTMAIGLNPELIEAHQKPIPQDRLTDYRPSPAEMYWIAKPAHRILNLNKSLETNPGQVDLFKDRAAQYYRLWNYEQAIADYSSFLALQPEDARALHFRGLAYEQTGQFDRALEDYQRAIAINPQLSDVYINRGVALGRMGNLRQAIASLAEGIRLAPQNPDAYFNRGTAYYQLGDLARAIEDFSQVIRLSPSDEGAYYWRGVSNEEAGRQGESIADYRQFLVLSQDPRAREEIEGRLRRWNAGKPDSANRRGVSPDDRQKTKPETPEKPDRDFDIHDLILALGERALRSIWFGTGVDCYGQKAEQLYAFTNQDKPIDGRDFLAITSGIRQTIAGDFQAFDPGARSPWIFIRAWDGSGFYVEIDDPNGMERLTAQFPSVEEVDEASPPYEGLFIRI